MEKVWYEEEDSVKVCVASVCVCTHDRDDNGGSHRDTQTGA